MNKKKFKFLGISDVFSGNFRDALGKAAGCRKSWVMIPASPEHLWSHLPFVCATDTNIEIKIFLFCH